MKLNSLYTGHTVALFILGAITLSAPQVTSAQNQIGAANCRDAVNQHLAMEHRLWRAMLYGKPLAEDAKINSVRYDTDGWSWIKEDEDEWVTGHQAGLQWADATMDANDEHADFIPIKGIFETKRVLTSELVPYILQSVRALECRSQAYCVRVQNSIGQSGDDPVDLEDIQPIGCMAFTNQESIPQCHFAVKESNLTEKTDALGYCTEITNQMIRREVELVKLAVEYDAGYRTLLQFAGNFDIFLKEIRWPLAGTVRQAARLMGNLQQFPCFLASCDSSPPPDAP